MHKLNLDPSFNDHLLNFFKKKTPSTLFSSRGSFILKKWLIVYMLLNFYKIRRLVHFDIMEWH